MSSVCRWGILGAANIARKNWKAIRMSGNSVVTAVGSRDVAKALDVWMRDFDIDRLCASLFRDFLALMTENPLAITLSVHLLFCVKNVERMGDHATNMAEAIHYMVKGEALSRERPKADVVSGLSLATGELGEDWLASAAALPSTG